MKKSLLVLCWLLAGLGFSAKAGEMLGSDLTYWKVSNNEYFVTFNYLRDCSIGEPDSVLNLQMVSPGCNAGRLVSMKRLGQPVPVNPYCPAAPAYCAGSGAPAAVYKYGVTITLNASEAACTDWFLRLSWPGQARANMANLSSSMGFFTEAFLKHGPNLHNSSPEFAFQTYRLASVYHNNANSFYLNAAEADGDSLSFELDGVMTAAGQPVNYKTGYSVNSPVSSSTGFNLNSRTGEITLTPSAFVAGTARSLGANRYAVGVKIREYRKVNNTVTLVGFIRQEILVEVEEAPFANSAPFLKTTLVNGTPIATTNLVTLVAGQQNTVQFFAWDPDTTDNIKMTIGGFSKPNATFQITNNNLKPVGTFTWTPAASDIGTQNFIQIQLEDNGCPKKTIANAVVEVRVAAPTGLPKISEKGTLFFAYPNPFQNQVTFKIQKHTDLKGPTLVIYNNLGQEIDRLNAETLGTGEELHWQKAAQFPAGNYVARLITPDGSEAIKFVKLP